MRRILVVGGAGYIGSHVCKALHQAGFVPVVYDNLSQGHSWAVQWGPLVQADLEDEEALDRAFETFQPEAVVHLASLINVRDAIQNPALYYEHNLGGALALLKAMRRAEVLRIVFSSTAAIYGMPHYSPIDEKHPKAPLNAYGKTKWAIEGMLEDFSAAHGIQFVTLRYFNACGADLEGQIGEAHMPETHLIPLVIQAALGEREVLKIYGTDHATPDGTAVRDYVHVMDLAAAHVQALQFLQETQDCLQVNLGTGTGYSVQQIIEAVERFGNLAVPVEIVPRLAHDSSVLVADARLAQKTLGWQARYSDLETIISSAWRWNSIVKAPTRPVIEGLVAMAQQGKDKSSS
jgi:UDP-glucose-4-epimerase GalE